MGINEVVQVGSRIKKYRKSKGITQKEVARLAGITAYFLTLRISQ